MKNWKKPPADRRRVLDSREKRHYRPISGRLAKQRIGQNDLVHVTYETESTKTVCSVFRLHNVRTNRELSAHSRQAYQTRESSSLPWGRTLSYKEHLQKTAC